MASLVEVARELELYAAECRRGEPAAKLVAEVLDGVARALVRIAEEEPVDPRHADHAALHRFALDLDCEEGGALRVMKLLPHLRKLDAAAPGWRERRPNTPCGSPPTANAVAPGAYGASSDFPTGQAAGDSCPANGIAAQQLEGPTNDAGGNPGEQAEASTARGRPTSIAEWAELAEDHARVHEVFAGVSDELAAKRGWKSNANAYRERAAEWRKFAEDMRASLSAQERS